MAEPKQKPSKESVELEMVREFVDLMMLVDAIVEEYGRRKHPDDQEFLDQIDFRERVLIASVLKGLQLNKMAEQDFELRSKQFAAAMGGTGGRAGAPTDAERAAVLRTTMNVQVDPMKASTEFVQLAESYGLNGPRARQFMALLTRTPQGVEMMKVLLFEVVQAQRARGG